MTDDDGRDRHGAYLEVVRGLVRVQAALVTCREHLRDAAEAPDPNAEAAALRAVLVGLEKVAAVVAAADLVTRALRRRRPLRITCPRCGRTSYSLHDVSHRYCGACHRFHDDDEPTMH